MYHKLLAAGIAAATILACAEPVAPPSELVPGGSMKSIDETGIWFEVTGFTYGPGRSPEEATTPKCVRGGADTWTSETMPFWYTVTIMGITYELYTFPVFTIGKHSEPCTIMSGWSTSNPYTGGSISIVGLSGNGFGNLALGSTPANWDRIRTIDNFPISATVQLTPWPSGTGECPNPTFDRWIIDNNYGAPRYDNPLYMSGSEIAYHRVSGEFTCHNPTPPPPPPGDGGGGGYCDDPSICNQGGGNLVAPETRLRGRTRFRGGRQGR